MTHIVLIAAASENNVIGIDGGLPWSLPDDLKHFKRATIGRPVVMGRKTFDELFQKPLSKRPNIIIISRTMGPTEGVTVARSLDEAIDLARPMLKAARAADPAIPDEICIIGGGEIYRQALPVATHITLTRVHAEVAGDTTFPDFNDQLWQLDRAETHERDDRHAHAFTIEWWFRR